MFLFPKNNYFTITKEDTIAFSVVDKQFENVSSCLSIWRVTGILINPGLM